MARATEQQFDKASASGDARIASEALEAWLARQSGAADDAPISEMCRLLTAICEAPLLNGDSQALSILEEMAAASSMEDFVLALDRLAARIETFLGGAGRSRSGTGVRRRAARRLLRL